MVDLLPLLTSNLTYSQYSDKDDGLADQVPPALRSTNRAAIDGLYIHVPFCFHKCHYCDFYSIVEASAGLAPGNIGPRDRQAPFVERLIQELEQRNGQIKFQPQTIFVGGGTPTLLRPELCKSLLWTLNRLVDIGGVDEFTVEANPETVNSQIIQILAAGGVNRISIGAQSFDRQQLKTLERSHDPANVHKAIRIARSTGIRHINVDLIFAIPGQTMQMLETDLDTVLALEPDHISYYGLTYEPQTALTARLGMGHVTRVDLAIEQQMYERIIQRLNTAGFEHYEISNWAQPGHRCQHNLLYWRNGNWLGVGPAAASHVNGHRWKNQPHLDRYLAQAPEPPTTDHEHLPASRRIGEQLMLRLRLRQGVPRTWFNQSLPPSDPRRAIVSELTEIGMLEWTDDHLRLTHQGVFVADAVIEKLL